MNVDASLVLLYGHIEYYLSTTLPASPQTLIQKSTSTKEFDTIRLASDLNMALSVDLDNISKLEYSEGIYGTGGKSKLNFIKSIGRKLTEILVSTSNQ